MQWLFAGQLYFILQGYYSVTFYWQHINTGYYANSEMFICGLLLMIYKQF